MREYNVDLLDGFDGREIVYDEKKEKSYHARIWWALFIAAVLILLRGVTFHIDEIKMVHTGKQIVAGFWIKTYMIFGVATLFCGWRLWKIYKG